MPAQRASLLLELTFDNVEFEKLAAGSVPKEMEDKWFSYFERPWLYLHRSWTGFCVYQVRFDADGGSNRVAEVAVNRNRDQYRGLSDEQDALLLKILLYQRVGRDCKALWQQYKASLPSGGAAAG